MSVWRPEAYIFDGHEWGLLSDLRKSRWEMRWKDELTAGFERTSEPVGAIWWRRLRQKGDGIITRYPWCIHEKPRPEIILGGFLRVENDIFVPISGEPGAFLKTGPAVFADCPECGAKRGELCLSPKTRRPVRTSHVARALGPLPKNARGDEDPEVREAEVEAEVEVEGEVEGKPRWVAWGAKNSKRHRVARWLYPREGQKHLPYPEYPYPSTYCHVSVTTARVNDPWRAAPSGPECQVCNRVHAKQLGARAGADT